MARGLFGVWKTIFNATLDQRKGNLLLQLQTRAISSWLYFKWVPNSFELEVWRLSAMPKCCLLSIGLNRQRHWFPMLLSGAPLGFLRFYLLVFLFCPRSCLKDLKRRYVKFPLLLTLHNENHGTSGNDGTRLPHALKGGLLPLCWAICMLGYVVHVETV